MREAVRWSSDGSQPSGHYVGECGHPVPGGPAWHVGPCGDCDPSATYLADLAAAVQEIGRLRCVLREVCALADDAPTITDEQLRDRLLTLASYAR